MIKFDDKEIEKCRFHQYKSPIWINNIHINIIVVSKRVSFGKNHLKYFIGYKNAEK